MKRNGVTKKKKRKGGRKTRAEIVAMWRQHAKDARNFLRRAAKEITLVRPAIPTTLVIEDEGILVTLAVNERDHGKPIGVEFRWAFPSYLTSREHALDWIYECLRVAWTHELNEALFVDGARRRELHDLQGRTIDPPGDALASSLDLFKRQLAAFLMGSPR